jgi:murein DD-endopeptidase MepM/ murein hydrolase activator NlpD
MPAPKVGTYISPTIVRFPVCIPPDFVPTDIDKDGVDQSWRRKDCPGFDPDKGYAPKSGGGYESPRGKNPRTGKPYDHRAWDIMTGEAVPIVAIADGIIPEKTRLKRRGRKVPGVGQTKKGGNYFVLVTDDGTDWYGSHLVVPAVVQPGERVVAGQLIGYVGRSGNGHYSSGKKIIGCPHLHLRGKDKNGVYFPPERYLLQMLKDEAWKWVEGQPELPVLKLE